MIDVNNDWVKNGGYFRVPVSDMDKLLIRLEAAEQLAEQLDHPRISLIRERNELAQKLEAAEWERDEGQKIAHAIMDERDALAAHVERLRRAAYEVCNDSFSYGGTSRVVDAAGDLATGDRGKYPCSMTALAEAAISGPETSLARRDLLKQADMLAGMIRLANGEHWTIEELEMKERKLRQQAEAQK